MTAKKLTALVCLLSLALYGQDVPRLGETLDVCIGTQQQEAPAPL